MNKRANLILANAHYYIINKFGSLNLVFIVNVILYLLLLITIICVFVPFSPGMPTVVDAERFAMNYGLSQGMAVGKELIYTYGPFVCLYSMQYHPYTDFIMVSGGLYLALLYWTYFIFLMKNVQWQWVLFFCVVIAGLIHSRDALFFSLPLLLGLVTFKMLSVQGGWLFRNKFNSLYIIFLFSPLGLLPLIKGSMLILCGLVAALCSALFVATKHRFVAIICLLSPVFSMLFFWTASGQAIANLPDYFISMVPIVSGYTEAMAIDGAIREVILYLVSSGFLLLVISIQKKIPNTLRIFLFSLYFVFLFLSFKAGFIRHDGHAAAAAESILIAGFLLPFILNNWMKFPAIVLALICWFYIGSHYIKISTEIFINNVKSTYILSWHGIENRVKNRSWPKVEFDVAVKSIGEQASFPVLQGTTDIYSYNQSYLITSGNTWYPRPIFQSYSVYTPELTEINRKHLLGNKAPDNIIFRVESIDRRFPSIEDGASWPILIYNYRPTQITNDFLFLKKKENLVELDDVMKLTSEKYNFGESINISKSSSPIFAEIEIKPTILGRIASILYKPSQLTISVELNSGIKKQYRIISGMTKSGFLISPLIENTAEFGMLYGNIGFLGSKMVKSIIISPNEGSTILWANELTITFSQLKNTPRYDIVKIYKMDKLDEFDDELLNSNVIEAKKCEGAIEVINGTLAPQKFSASGLVEIIGWLAISVGKGILPEAVYLVFTDSKGKHLYLKTRMLVRPELGGHFKNQQLTKSGYITKADISALAGTYTLGLAIKQANKIQMCPQFNIPATITK